MSGRPVNRTPSSGRSPVEEGLPTDLPPAMRRLARIRLVASRRLAGITIVLDGLHDPHNISAVLRSCDGFGIQHLHLIGRRAELPLSRMITRGCEKWLSLHYHPGPLRCATALHAQGFELWAADPDRQAPTLDSLDFSRKIALVFGAERDGLSEELRSACDGRYQIPMPGFSQSLNVSVAAAVSLYVGASARRSAVGRESDLTEDEIEHLAQTWIQRDAERRRRAAPQT